MLLSDDPLEWPRYAGLTLERYNVVRSVAGRIVQCHLEGNDWGAYEEYRGLTEFDEVNVLWKILRPHSSLRADIKRRLGEERAGEGQTNNGAESAHVGHAGRGQ